MDILLIAIVWISLMLFMIVPEIIGALISAIKRRRERNKFLKDFKSGKLY